MEIGKAVERISELPKEVIEEILTNIPIRDAVRTSALSRNWRYKWTSIPELVFENRSIEESESGIQDGTRLVNAVNHVLMRHNGVISKFEVHLANHGFPCDVSRWILALSRRSTVNHMVLEFDENGPYQLPDSLFTCQSLRILILGGCILRLPPFFKGFSLLAHLVLCYMNLSNETFESLLPKLPLLKELAVLYCNSALTHFNIRAPNLDYLRFDSICCSINFLETPKLTDIDIRIWIPRRPSTCRLAEILKKLPDVTNVAISQPIMKYSPSDPAPRRLNAIYGKLKSVKVDINFTDKRQLVAVLCLCRSSPYLEELSLKALWGGPSIHSDDFWIGKLHREEGDIFRHLKTVKLTGFKGVRLDVETVQFILLNAVVLKSISINWGIRVPVNNRLLRLLEGIMRFKRASSEAEVIFSQP